MEKGKNSAPEHRKEINRLSAKVKLMSKAAKKLTWEKKTDSLDLQKDSLKAWTLLDKLSGKNRRTNPEPIVTEYGKARKLLEQYCKTIKETLPIPHCGIKGQRGLRPSDGDHK